MANVLMLGGTGAIGRYVLRECLNRGYKVTITTRGDKQAFEAGTTYVKGDALDFHFVWELLKDKTYDVVVDFMVYKTHEFQARVSDFLRNTEHYVFLSSYRVFAGNNGNAITETSSRLLDNCNNRDYLTTDEYALLKARQENALRSHSQKNWTIVRPSITYAENRLQFGCLEAGIFLSRAKKNLPVVIPSEMLNRKTTMTWAGDTAKMIVSLLLNEKAMGTDFNVLTSEFRTWREISNIYSNAIGLKVLEVDVPSYLSLGLNRYQVLYDRLVDRVCDNTKICDIAKISQGDLLSPEEGLRKALSDSSIVSSTYSRMNGRMDLLCGVKRRGYSRSLKEGVGYLVGRMTYLNGLAVRVNAKKFAPPYT